MRHVSAGDTAEDVGCGKTGVIVKVRDGVIGNAELAEAMKQVLAGPGAARDVVLNLSTDWNWTADLGVETRGGDGSGLSECIDENAGYAANGDYAEEILFSWTRTVHESNFH
ncbi:MAG: hypothetical protein P0120_01480 [Nitrospira sp.]|nr:hypothetical protein [Nitrospira sp.]